MWTTAFTPVWSQKKPEERNSLDGYHVCNSIPVKKTFIVFQCSTFFGCIQGKISGQHFFLKHRYAVQPRYGVTVVRSGTQSTLKKPLRDVQEVCGRCFVVYILEKEQICRLLGRSYFLKYLDPYPVVRSLRSKTRECELTPEAPI